MAVIAFFKIHISIHSHRGNVKHLLRALLKPPTFILTSFVPLKNFRTHMVRIYIYIYTCSVQLKIFVSSLNLDPSISFLFLLERFLPAVLLLHSPDLPPLASALNISKSTTKRTPRATLMYQRKTEKLDGENTLCKHRVQKVLSSNLLFRDAVSYLLMSFRISRSLLKRKSPPPPLREEIENNLERRVGQRKF